MRIYVKILRGNEIEVAVSPSHTVLEVKHILEMQFSMKVEEQKLVFKGKTLLDAKRLNDYNIKNGDKLFLFQKKADCSSSTPVTPSTHVQDTFPPTPAVRPNNFSTATPISQRMSVPPVELSSCSTMVLWNQLKNFLERHFTKQDAAKVLIEFQKDFYNQMKLLSLDDIERLARNKLHGVGMNGHEQMT